MLRRLKFIFLVTGIFISCAVWSGDPIELPPIDINGDDFQGDYFQFTDGFGNLTGNEEFFSVIDGCDAIHSQCPIPYGYGLTEEEASDFCGGSIIDGWIDGGYLYCETSHGKALVTSDFNLYYCNNGLAADGDSCKEPDEEDPEPEEPEPEPEEEELEPEPEEPEPECIDGFDCPGDPFDPDADPQPEPEPEPEPEPTPEPPPATEPPSPPPPSGGGSTPPPPPPPSGGGGSTPPPPPPPSGGGGSTPPPPPPPSGGGGSTPPPPPPPSGGGGSTPPPPPPPSGGGGSTPPPPPPPSGGGGSTPPPPPPPSGGGGNGEGEGEGNGNVSASCQNGISTVQCNGDAVQCAIYKQQHQTQCTNEQAAIEYADGLTESAVTDATDYADQLTLGDAIPEETINIGDLFQNAIDKGRWLPHECIADEPFTALGVPLSLSWKPVCDFASMLAPLIVMLASLAFGFTVIRAIKG